MARDKFTLSIGIEGFKISAEDEEEAYGSRIADLSTTHC